MTEMEEIACIARQIPPFRKQYLAEVAASRGKSVADWLRWAVMEYLDKEDK
jgi:hypothetical protein